MPDILTPEQVEKLTTATNNLATKTEQVLTQITAKEKEWDGKLHDVAEAVKAVEAKTSGGDRAELIKEIGKIVDEQIADANRRGVFSQMQGNTFAPTLVDTWAKSQADPFAYDPSTIPELLAKGNEQVLVHDKEIWKGIDVIMQMPIQDDMHRALCHMGVDVMLLNAMGIVAAKNEGIRYSGFASTFPKTAKKWKRYVELYAQHVKATVAPMDTTDQAYWVPTGWSNEIRELILLESRLSPVFPSFTQPTKVFTLPLDLTDTVGDYIPEQGDYKNPYEDADPTRLGQTLTDAQTTLTAFKFRSRLMTSAELDEDAMVAILPLMRMKVVKILANSRDKAHIDGQTTTIDTGDAPGSYDVRKPYDGLRRFCSVAGSSVDFDGTLTTTGLISSMPLALGERAAEIAQLLHLTSPAGFYKMIALAEVLTVDKFGPAATVHKGQLGAIGGVPILVNRYVRADLNVAGIYDDTTKTRTIDLLFRRDAWIIGDRRRVTVNAQYIPQLDQWDVIAMERYSFANVFGTSYKTAVVGIDIPNS